MKRNAGKGLPFLFFISANSPPSPLNFDLMLAIAAKSPYLFVETGFSKCSLQSFSSQENFCDPLLELVLQDLWERSELFRHQTCSPDDHR